MTHLQKNEIYYLLVRFFDNDINNEQREKLLAWAQNDPDASKAYWGFVKDIAIIRTQMAGQIEIEEGASDDLNDVHDFWTAMVNYEKIAPEIEVPKEKLQPELIRKVVYPPREKRKVSKFNLVFLALNFAAMLFFILFLKFAPRKDGVEVATLTDSMNAKWTNANCPMQNGTRICSNKMPLMLSEGVVELTFDNNTKVTIEGPAEFRILDDDMLKLYYGQLYSHVPPEAYGFQVSTQHTKITDLGTEFGVKEEIDGDTEVHVLKGKVGIVSGIISKRTDFDLLAGSACKLNATTKEIEEIPCEDNLFVRQIDSKYNFVWRGQKNLDLADVVGGGNGFGSGQRNVGWDFATGELSDIKVDSVNRYAANTYLRLESASLIDGIFVPNGQTEQVISSLGHVFSECPVTGGNYYTEIGSSPKIIDNAEAILGGYNFSQGKAASLLLHANAGITFDLQAIRSQLGGMKISRFRSIIGICDSTWRPCNADFWILVDGKLRYSKQKVRKKGILDTVDIDLSVNDRFLTLVTTDGGDVPNRPIVTIDSDWCLFAEPVLVLE